MASPIQGTYYVHTQYARIVRTDSTAVPYLYGTIPLSRFAISGNRKVLKTQKAEDLSAVPYHPTHLSMLFIKTILVALFISATLASPSNLRGLQDGCPSTPPASFVDKCKAQAEGLRCSYNFALFPVLNSQGKCTGKTNCQPIEVCTCDNKVWGCFSLSVVPCDGNAPKDQGMECDP
jgi:hypothetical protein